MYKIEYLLDFRNTCKVHNTVKSIENQLKSVRQHILVKSDIQLSVQVLSTYSGVQWCYQHTVEGGGVIDIQWSVVVLSTYSGEWWCYRHTVECGGVSWLKCS